MLTNRTPKVPQVRSLGVGEQARVLCDAGEGPATVIAKLGSDSLSAWQIVSMNPWGGKWDFEDLRAAAANSILCDLDRAHIHTSSTVLGLLAVDDARILAEWAGRNNLARAQDATDLLFVLEHFMTDHRRLLSHATSELASWCRTLGLDAGRPWPMIAAAVLRADPTGRTSVYSALYAADGVKNPETVAALLRAGACAPVDELDELAARL